MRLSREARQAQIISVGKTIAIRDGLAAVTPERIAQNGPQDDARITVATIRRYFHTRESLWVAIARECAGHKLIACEAKLLGIRLSD